MVSSTLGRSTNNSISMSRAGYRVYIGNLSPNCRKQDLELFFKGYGYLIDILIKQGYGFVKFETYRDADDAVYDLDGKNFMEKRSGWNMFANQVEFDHVAIVDTALPFVPTIELS